MRKELVFEKLDPFVFVTKLAGFEHSEYIQPNATKVPVDNTDIPMVQGKNIREGVFVEKYDWYISKKIADLLPRSILNRKCILIPYVGSNLGEVGLFPNKYRCQLASNIAKLELKTDKYDLEYVMYYLQSPIGQSYLFQEKQGSSQPNITMESIRNTQIIKKDILEQKKIVKILSLLTKKIERNNCINDNLAQMLRLLYEQWFYRFEFPNEQNLPYNRANGEFEWNDKLKRRIPKGWKVQTMLSNELFSVISSGIDRFSTKKYYATADIIGTSIGEGSDIEYETRESRANMQPVINSIWFAKMKNSIKHLFLNKEMSSFVDNSILSTGFYGLKCNEISFEYIASVVSAPIFEITKDRLSHGATQQGIGDDDMANITLLIPDDTTLRMYHETTKGFFAKISNNILENKRLIAIRNFLLPLLMNGQVAIAE